MQNIHGFDYFPLEFDRKGDLAAPAQAAEIKTHIASNAVTDALFIAHGWRNDANEATSLYTGFLKTLRDNMANPAIAAKLAGRTFAVAGVFWPSKSFPEGPADQGSAASAGEPALLELARAELEALKDEFDDPARLAAIDDALALLPQLSDDDLDAQDDFVSHLLSLVQESELDPSEGFDRVAATPGHELLQRLLFPVILPTSAVAEEGGAAAVDSSSAAIAAGDEGEAQGLGGLISSIGGKVGKMLNFTTWYLMKERSGIVGANGLARVVREVHAAAPQSRLHLIGHSLGGRLAASCARALAAPPPVQLATLTLLQAAFSHYGFSANNGFGAPGFFRAVIDRRVVRGPILATHSRKDTVVGYAYALSSRAAGDNTRAIGDANDQYGGIGRNGSQRTSESVEHPLGPPGAAYIFQAGKVNNLNGDTIVQDHGDVKRAEITWAFATALAGG